MAKYEPKLVKDLMKEISNGATYKDACASVGISFETFNTWHKDESKPEFAEALKKANSSFKKTHLGNISKAGAKGAWQASAWILERKFPNEYGRNAQGDNNEVTVTIKYE